MRAASVVPSFNGINVCSMTRTALGKFVTITGHSVGKGQGARVARDAPAGYGLSFEIKPVYKAAFLENWR
jgi:hypothetical protein